MVVGHGRPPFVTISTGGRRAAKLGGGRLSRGSCFDHRAAVGDLRCQIERKTPAQRVNWAFGVGEPLGRLLQRLGEPIAQRILGDTHYLSDRLEVGQLFRHDRSIGSGRFNQQCKRFLLNVRR